MCNLPVGKALVGLNELKFKSVIKTEFVTSDGEKSTIITLVPKLGMFDEIVMGLNKALKSGGVAIAWQSVVYSIRDGQLTTPFVYYPQKA